MGLIDIEGWDSFSDEEKEVLLDLGQLALDIIGIVEPTPFADSANAVISMTRGDWWGSLLSAAGVIPYIGDVAKLGKIRKYIRSFDKAVTLAQRSARFAKPVKAVAERILAAINRIPFDKLPDTARRMFQQLRQKLSDFLGGGGLRMTRLDRLTDETLRRVFGSTRNVGMLPRRNVRTIIAFFEKYKVGNGNPAEWAELIKGIDLHAVDAVKVVPMKPGQVFAQYVELSRPVDRRVGQWMVKAQGAVSDRNIGLAGHNRERQLFRLKEGVEMLQSKAAGAADHWTMGGPKPHKAFPIENGARVMKNAEHVAGGGQQFFLPGAWKYLEPANPVIRIGK